MHQIIIKLKDGQEVLLRNLTIETLKFMIEDLEDWKVEVQTPLGFTEVGPKEIDLAGTLELQK